MSMWLLHGWRRAAAPLTMPKMLEAPRAPSRDRGSCLFGVFTVLHALQALRELARSSARPEAPQAASPQPRSHAHAWHLQNAAE